MKLTPEQKENLVLAAMIAAVVIWFAYVAYVAFHPMNW